ncbi:MAG: BTAD domain-containing putative transcriptional regulator [Desulfosalsimonas sp.]
MAKISRPRVQKVLQRRRLFDLLDETRACQATWVCGPGGSGKTTFIASYIEENQLPCLWYQIDEGDSDIAAFFYYMGLAGKGLASEEKDLPLLTPEYALGISTFTRRFFENLFNRLDKPWVLVLDNYQEAPPDCLLHEVVRNALSVTPENINLFILSRTEPPPILARAMASNLLSKIGWPALRLQSQETRDLVRLLTRTPPSEAVIDSLHEKVDGWLAGLLLLLNRAATEAIDPKAFTQFTSSEVFDYFTSEIKALSLFQEQEDTAGICLSLCGILDSITFALDSFKPLDQWIPKLNRLSREYEALPSAEVRGKLSSTALFSLAFRSPDHPEFKTWEKRGQTILQENNPGEIKLRLIVAWAWHRLFTGNLAEARHFIEMYRELVHSPNIAPYLLLGLKNLQAFYHFLGNDSEACSKMVADSLDLASTTGIHLISPIVLGHGAAAALSAGDIDSADEHLRNMDGYAHSFEWIFIYFRILKAWKAFLEKDHTKALLQSESAKAYVGDSGMPMTDAVWHQGMAIALQASGNQVEALQYLEKALLISNRVGYHQIAFGCYLTQAEFALDAGNETAARDLLQKAMAIGKAKQYVTTWFWRADAMTRLCLRALEENIEVDYVQHLIRNRRLMPEYPPLQVENFPWPLKVFTLGRFSLLVDGKPISFAGKVQEKPLFLLKAIISLGGHGVSVNRISDFLWPDADGDLARSNFRTTLHRLRKMFGYHDAIYFNSGNITLNPTYFWVDAWAFERALSAADKIRQSAANEKELQRAASFTQKAVDLYNGPLFQSDEDMAISLRQHLHHRFVQAVEQLGDYRQSRKEYEKAVALYEKGLKIDELVESFYRGLMVCKHRLGGKPGTWEAYNRCKKVMAENLNTSPSAKTEALKNSLLNQ